MNIDTIIAEQIQAQSTIAVNRVVGSTIQPLIKSYFDAEISLKIESIIDGKASDIDHQVEEMLDEIVERHVDDKMVEAVHNFMGDMDFSDYISADTIEATVSDHLENYVELDDLVEAAVKERTDQRLFETVNDCVNDIVGGIDLGDCISDRRVESAVDVGLPAAVANYMSDNLSNYFRSPEGEKVLSDFLTSYAGRSAIARTFTTILLENSNV